MTCFCKAPGHCLWHKTVTTAESFQRCRENGSPSPPSAAKPCCYLGAVQDATGWTRKRLGIQVMLQCRLHERCTLAANRAHLAACQDCKDRLTVDDPDVRNRFIDPLVVTDRHGVRTHALRDLLQGRAAFLVCGGPSVKQVAYGRLAERGIFSLGINNVAGLVPVSAFCCSDPPSKFHWGIWHDPKILKFVPTPKLRGGRGQLRRKDGETFSSIPDGHARNSPNVFGFERRSWLMPDETWFIEPSASWGNQNEGVERFGQSKTAATMLLGLRLLQYCGARQVFLLGCDFWMDPAAGVRDNYAFAEDRKADAIESNNRQYAVTNAWLCQLRPVFERWGFETYNCYRESRLRAFDHVPFEQALEICRGDVAPEPFDCQGWYIK